MNLLDKQKFNPRVFWNFIKGIGTKKHKLPRMVLTTDGAEIDNHTDVLGSWKEYFCKLLNPECDTNPQTLEEHIDPLHLDATELNEERSYMKR